MFYYLKRNGIVEEFEITRNELKNVVKSLQNLFKIIRISETIFFIDNLEGIRQQLNLEDLSQANIRFESQLLNLNHSINSQGFNITNLEYDLDNAVMDVIDLESYTDNTKKAIHSSQFLYNLWILTNSKKLQVNYHLSNGVKFFTSEIISDDFENDNDDIPFHILMKKVKFIYINTEIKQNINPFENIILPNDTIKNPQQFYSQKGLTLSNEEFAKQYILSIFCNYLALKNEGFTNIKINIGNDGAMVRTEKPISFVLMVPAKIINKAFQQKLIELLNNTIYLYDNKMLLLEIVNEAKEKNDYFRKLSIIKDHKKSSGI